MLANNVWVLAAEELARDGKRTEALDLRNAQPDSTGNGRREQGLGIGLIGGEQQLVLAGDGEVIAAEEGRDLPACIIVQAQFLAERIGFPGLIELQQVEGGPVGIPGFLGGKVP